MNSKLTKPSTSNQIQQANNPLICSLNNDNQFNDTFTPSSVLISLRNKLSKNKELRDFASGLTGGVLATTTLHPLDVLKIRLAGINNFYEFQL